jgi:hypothetical protein
VQTPVEQPLSGVSVPPEAAQPALTWKLGFDKLNRRRQQFNRGGGEL